MRIVFPLAIACSSIMWAQQQQPSPETVEKLKAAAQSAVTEAQQNKPGSKAATPATQGQAKEPKTVNVEIPAPAVLPLSSLPAKTVIATVDGKPVTAGDLQAVLKALPAQTQKQAQADRRAFVEQYGILRRLADEARKAKLDEQSPYKEAIEYGTMQVLYQAEMSRKFADIPVTADETKKVYEANKERFTQAKVKGIYLPFTNAPVSQADAEGKKLMTEAEAKEKAEELVKQIRGGADFVKLVKEYSRDPNSVEKDGDFGYLHQSDQLPQEIKNAVFAAKPGDVTEPVRQPNGFYIFRIEEAGVQPYNEVQGAITNEVRNTRFGEWINNLRKSIDVKMTYEVPKGVEVTAQPSGSAAPAAEPAPATPAPAAPPSK